MPMRMRCWMYFIYRYWFRLGFLDGKEGFSITPLRPSGTAIFDENKFDVVTEGEYIPASKYIKVIKIEGRRIIVREI